jgi:hypothetical protein
LYAGLAVEAPKDTIYSVQPPSHVNMRENHFPEFFGL